MDQTAALVHNLEGLKVIIQILGYAEVTEAFYWTCLRKKSLLATCIPATLVQIIACIILKRLCCLPTLILGLHLSSQSFQKWSYKNIIQKAVSEAVHITPFTLLLNTYQYYQVKHLLITIKAWKSWKSSAKKCQAEFWRIDWTQGTNQTIVTSNIHNGCLHIRLNWRLYDLLEWWGQNFSHNDYSTKTILEPLSPY